MGTNVVTVGAEAAKLAGLQIDLLQKMRDGQRTIEHFKWFLGLKKEECDQLVAKANSIIDDHFRLVNTFPLTVPEDYDHATHLDLFCRLKKDEVAELFEFYRYSDKAFNGVTNKLIPGQRFRVKVFQVKEMVSCEDCLVLLESEKAVLPGVQGLVLAYELAKTQIPADTWCISLDKKAALPSNRSSGYHHIPCLIVTKQPDNPGCTGKIEYSVSSTEFESSLGKHFCILCFCGLS